MGPRVLLIKLGALGDVVRTGALLPGLRQLYDEPVFLTWLTSPAAVELVRRIPGVDRVLAYGPESLNLLSVEKFDVVICLDKEPEPCAVAMTANADSRMGIGLSRYGTPFPLNQAAEYFFELGLNNDEKFNKNRKSYQQLIYEALALTYQGERFAIDLTEEDRRAAQQKFDSFGAEPSTRWVGLNAGAGSSFAYKAWRPEGYEALVRELASRRPEVRCVLLGGPEEAELLAGIEARLSDVPVFNAGTDNSLGEFTAIIDRCDVVVSGDTLAMHLAVARQRRVVALFGPTCEQEITLYGMGTKIKSPIECSPCYRRTCDKDPTCQDKILESQVLEAVLEQLDAAPVEQPSRAGASSLALRE